MLRLPVAVWSRHCRCLPPAAVLISSLNATPLNDVQEAASEWARLRSETARLDTEWLAERALLEASITNLNTQAEQLELQHQAFVAESAEAQQEVDQLTSANQTRAEKLMVATARIADLAKQLVDLRPALPPRLSAALDLSFRTLANPDLSPADRMRHTMAILNRCQQFDQTFVITEEVLTLGTESQPRLLEIVYFGLAQACALDRSANEAFVGRPVDGVWQWENVPGLANEATKLIAVRQDDIPPDFVSLPIQLTGGEQ